MTDDDEQDRKTKHDLDLIKSHVAQLSEHFETVQVICTRDMTAELDGTICVHHGAGNWFARYGSVRDWLIKREEAMRIDERKDV